MPAPPGIRVRLPSNDAALARKLVKFGRAGVGGFSDLGEDEAGVFVLRRVPERTLDALGKGERIDGLGAIVILRDLARALAFCERERVFPGPLRPQEIVLEGPGTSNAYILAESWVRALLGASRPGRASSGPSPRWTPPEVAAGEVWGSSANRYVLGLAAYRLIAGAHPFSGGGVRDAMDAARLPPPPFEDAIAGQLKPGIQSFVLALLDPDPAKRFPSAEAIVLRCDELLREPARPERAKAAPPSDASARKDAVPAALTHGALPGRLPALAAALPIALGLVIAAGGVLARPSSPTTPSTQRTLTQSPMKASTAQTCAPCHEKQVAEWERSAMAHSVKSPLFGALESLVEEQVGREARCPNGAGILRKAAGDVCRNDKSGLSVTGSGGEHWCVNCHSAGDNLRSTVPAWNANVDEASRRPLTTLLSAEALEGISCAVCHQTIGPVDHASLYQGNATWSSPVTGALFRTRPEDGRGVFGIANSGYLLDPSVLLTRSLGRGSAGDPIVHRRAPEASARYLKSSEFCGACHDVRLFGTDAIGVQERGEHFKRLRNAYSEWRTWADTEKAAGRSPASCQDCHMSLYPGVCVRGSATTDAAGGDCPPGFHFEARAPGEKARGMVAAGSREATSLSSHWFTSVDVPLANDFVDRWATDPTLDPNGVPLGLEVRRNALLRRTFSLAIGRAIRVGSRLEIPIEIENIGAGHRAPAGFSQEREIWLELSVRDARGKVVYEVGAIDRDDADLRDKVFLRTTTRDDVLDERGRPQGVFGADVVDGPDVPRWDKNPAFGGTTFRGRGLLNMQNGFLRCVTCIGIIDGEGRCQPQAGQGRTRADRFADGAYDIDTGECRSNLSGTNAFFETYFPVGALDAERGIAKAPDAILDQRSAPPGTVLRYTYELDTTGFAEPFTVRGRLRFRPFPPFLLRAFADYEARKASEGRRSRGPQVTSSMFARNHPIDLAFVSATVK
jgi:hypothetical protein